MKFSFNEPKNKTFQETIKNYDIRKNKYLDQVKTELNKDKKIFPIRFLNSGNKNNFEMQILPPKSILKECNITESVFDKTKSTFFQTKIKKEFSKNDFFYKNIDKYQNNKEIVINNDVKIDEKNIVIDKLPNEITDTESIHEFQKNLENDQKNYSSTYYWPIVKPKKIFPNTKNDILLKNELRVNKSLLHSLNASNHKTNHINRTYINKVKSKSKENQEQGFEQLGKISNIMLISNKEYPKENKDKYNPGYKKLNNQKRHIQFNSFIDEEISRLKNTKNKELVNTVLNKSSLIKTLQKNFDPNRHDPLLKDKAFNFIDIDYKLVPNVDMKFIKDHQISAHQIDKSIVIINGNPQLFINKFPATNKLEELPSENFGRKISLVINDKDEKLINAFNKKSHMKQYNRELSCISIKNTDINKNKKQEKESFYKLDNHCKKINSLIEENHINFDLDESITSEKSKICSIKPLDVMASPINLNRLKLQTKKFKAKEIFSKTFQRKSNSFNFDFKVFDSNYNVKVNHNKNSSMKNFLELIEINKLNCFADSIKVLESKEKFLNDYYSHLHNKSMILFGEFKNRKKNFK